MKPLRPGGPSSERRTPANDICSFPAGPARHDARGELLLRNIQPAMNEMSSLRARPIELAAESPFRLLTLEVTPAALELRRQDKVVTLEPRVMQVLVALHRSAGTVVSREDLIDLCWEGRIVGEDSLNRSVSQLRKALATEAAISVDTIPRIGYRLRVEGEEAVPTLPVPEPVERRGVSRRTKIAVASGALLICAGIAAFTTYARAPRVWSASGVRPLTQEPGVEMHPALSPDGFSVAYTAGQGFWEPRDIYLRNVSVGDATPVRLTDTPLADEFAPAWSPAGERLAFLRETDGRCEIVTMTPPNGAERIIGQCRNSYAGIAWLNANELILGDRPAGVRTRRLVAMDVTSGKSRPLTTPPESSLGDAAPAVSNDGRWIAFRRTAALGSDAVHLLDTKTGKERSLTTGGWKASGFTWAGDNRTLFFSSNRGGDFGLWAIDTRRQSEPSRVTLGMLPLGHLSSDRQSRQIAVETGRLQVNLSRISPDGAASTAVTSGQGVDWDPDVGPDGRILFASDRNGTNQIWTRRSDGGITRLTDMNSSYVHSPRWSPDGSLIAFIAVVEGRTDIYSIRPDGSGLTRITSDGAPKGRVAWSSQPGHIFFTMVNGADWQLMKRQLASGPSAVLPDSAGIAIVERTNNRIFARRVSEGSIIEIDARSGRIGALPVSIRTEGLETWAPRADGIVHVRGSGPHAALWLTTWRGAARQLAPLRQAPRATFAVARDGSIVAPRLIADDRNLMLIGLDASGRVSGF